MVPVVVHVFRLFRLILVIGLNYGGVVGRILTEEGPMPSRSKGLLQDEASDVVTPRLIATILGYKDIEGLF